MTTAAPRSLSQGELDVRTQVAWTAYSESLQGLAGREYEEAERDSWERLQRELQDIEELRAAPVGA
jgi:hypothetical protein